VGSVKIPSSITVDGWPETVRSIGIDAFRGCNEMTSVEIPSTVTSIQTSAFERCGALEKVDIRSPTTATTAIIGTSAFKDCKKLNSLSISSSVTDIKTSAFEGCSKLTSVVIPGRVNSIGDYAFSGCSEMTSVTILTRSDTSVSIGKGAFKNCTGLTSVTIPSSVTSIGEAAFIGCNGMTSVTISSRVTSIGRSAFSGCSKLMSVEIPSSVTIIRDAVFSGCSALTSVTIPDKVTYIGGCAFEGCSGLTSVDIPDSTILIDAYAFKGCSRLTSVAIPGSVTGIGNWAFMDCSGLTSVAIPSSVTNVGKGIFEGCSGLSVTFLSDMTSIWAKAMSGCSRLSVTFLSGSICDSALKGCSGLTSLSISPGVTGIGASAFEGCNGLTSVSIPGSVNIIGDQAFVACNELTSLTVDPANPRYRSDGGVLFDKSQNALTQYPGGLVGAYSIPAGVTSISGFAFKGCSGLTSVTIPGSVTDIGNSAFRDCSGLTSVAIPEKVNSIGGGAFAGCSALKSVTISSSVASVGAGIFEGSSGLSVTFLSDMTSIWATAMSGCSGLSVTFRSGSICDSALKGCSGLTSLSILPGVTGIGASAFEGCNGLTSVSIPGSVNIIGDQAFVACNGLTSLTVDPANLRYRSDGGVLFDKSQNALTQYPGGLVGAYSIPAGVTSISGFAFKGCSGLTSVAIPGSVTNIGNSAFRDCSGLRSVAISSGATNIGVSAFEGCSGLNVTFLSGSIGDSALKGCIALTGVTISSGVTDIEDSAFEGCSGLTSVEIPSSVTSIGTSAFKGCSGLRSVTLPSSVTSVGGGAFEGCSGFSVTFLSDVTNIWASALSGCSGVSATFLSGSIGDFALSECNKLTSVVISPGVSSIGASAFNNCTLLKSVTIPASVTNIGPQVFRGCSGLTSLTVDPANTKYSSDRGVLFDKSQHVLIQCPAGLLGAYSIPASVTSIGGHAFRGCSRLTSVEIPGSVTSIGEWAFCDCSGLTSVTIPSSVTSIGDLVFAGCSGLTSVTIPGSLISIGVSAFHDCRGLAKVTIPSSVTSIGNNAFFSCTGLKVAEFLGGAPSMGNNVFYHPASEFAVKFHPGAKDFTSPTWNGYPAGIIDIFLALSGNMSFGSVPLNSTKTSTMTITNSGGSTLNVAISYPAGFSGAGSSSIPARNSKNVDVTFAPYDVRSFDGAIIVSTTDGNSGSQTISVNGSGTAAPTRIIGLSGNLSFGSVTVNSTAQGNLTISNTGNTALNVTSISYPAGYSGAWSGSIPAGGSQNVVVTFAPTAVQSYNGTITVESNATSGSSTTAINGTATAAPSRIIGLSGNLSFGNLSVGSTKTATLTLNNTGNDALNVTSIVYPSGYSGAWIGSIPSGGSQNVTVTFSPTAVQSYNGTIIVNSNATSGNETIVVSGAGKAAPLAAPSTATISSSTDIPLTADAVRITGTLSLTLGFEPAPGTNLTIIKNTGTEFLDGTYSNIPQGGTFALTYNGKTYNFIANYYGGNGRSLVLQWPCAELAAWGDNNSGQLGCGNIPPGPPVPVAVDMSGVLAGKTFLAVSGGSQHSLALTSDGQVFAWGDNNSGQLGDNSTTSSFVPVAVGGDLAGKTVVAIEEGGSNFMWGSISHSLALTSDGQVFAWGDNSFGQLGSNSTAGSSVPVAISGDLAGRSVVAIAAGGKHSLALTSDGQVFAWGDNSFGQLGNNTTTSSLIPVAVNMSGSLVGKTVVAIAAGASHSLVVTSDGQAFAWGDNNSGQLGSSITTSSPVPVAVDISGMLAGKSLVEIDAGDMHSLALTSDGQIFAWGANWQGQLGDGTTTNSAVPLAVSGDLAGKTVAAIEAGAFYSLALTSDGQIFGWGENIGGQLGNVNMMNSPVPVAMPFDGVLQGRTVTGLTAGNWHSMAMLGAIAPTVTSQPANRTSYEGSNASFSVSASGTPAASVQWQVSTNGSAGPFVDITGNPTATTGRLKLSGITLAQNGSAYRAVFTNLSGSVTSSPALLAVQEVPNISATIHSITDIPFSGDSISVAATLSLTLGFEPAPGTNLTIIKNTGTEFLDGTYSNIPQGGTFALTYNGKTYNFIANYYGGNGRSLVLQWPCAELAAWGDNNSGQLGCGNIPPGPPVPVAVDMSGVLAGKTFLAVSGGSQHSLALTSDGQVFAWGDNNSGQLGDNSTTSSFVPVAVSGDLAGKTVVAIEAGGMHSLALTAEGQVFAWGDNGAGQLGNNSTTSSPVPVAVSGVMAGKTVVAIAAGMSHCLALTSDGQVFAWGMNYSGQLGNNSTASSPVPVAVDMSGVLAGKTVVAIASGDMHSIAMTSDGQVFAWGHNGNGQLGDGGWMDSPAPVAVSMTGVLTGKTAVAIAAGGVHSLALTAEGQVFAWGANWQGQLGNGTTTNSAVPLAVSGDLAGKTVAAIEAGAFYSLALTSDGQIFGWGDNMARQLGNVNMMNSPVPVAMPFDAVLQGRTVTGLTAGNWHSMAMLGAIAPTVTSQPANRTSYVGLNASFTASASGTPAASVQWQVSTNGVGGPFVDINGNPTATTRTLRLSGITLAQNGSAYRAVFTNLSGLVTSSPALLTVQEAPNISATIDSITDIPFSGDSISVAGTLNLTLGFEPAPGTNLTIIKNTGTAFLDGTYSNIPQGGTFALTYNGKTYNFIANYYGGNGRSLVLQWPCAELAAWGDNNSGQLGCGNIPPGPPTPVAVDMSGVLAGKTVTAVAAGGGAGFWMTYGYSLALTSDGQIIAWGDNSAGQLGNNSTASSPVPVPVDMSGALAGKEIVSIAAGRKHSLALTSDGQVIAWGENNSGQLGNNSTTSSPTPAAVTGVLADKTVVGIAAGENHSLALTSDGQVFAWGENYSGQLGNNSTAISLEPVAVDTSGVLAGRSVVAIAGGMSHSLALTSDGKLFAWGNNYSGQLGNNSTANSWVPVPVSMDGVLAGKTVEAIASGSSHSLALTSDGQVFAWGANWQGQLGDGTTTDSAVPVTVSGVLAGKTVGAIEAGAFYSLALTSDGQIFGWGDNMARQLGNVNMMNSPVPVAMPFDAVLQGRTVTGLTAGYSHSMAMLGAIAPTVTSQPANRTSYVGLNASFTASASGTPAASVQWQVSTNGVGGPFVDINGNPTATTRTLRLSGITLAQNGSAYRAVFTNLSGLVTSSPALLTVQEAPNISTTIDSITDIPFSGDSISVAGTLSLTLGFEPAPGTNLTIIKNTGTAFLDGTYSNLPQGGTVALTFNGKTYNFIANYYGGNGRSLVLQWPCAELAAWGDNSVGQLGSNGTFNTPIPVPVDMSGVLSGKTVVATAAGNGPMPLSLALTSEGNLFAWGYNSDGQLGNNSTTSSSVPVAVDMSGVLAGKTVVAIAVNMGHSLALTSDGQVFAWGNNSGGQLGNNSTASSSVAVPVDMSGALAGKTVVAIAAGDMHSMALTSDGNVFAWGSNWSGQLGNNSTTSSPVPVPVDMNGALAGKTVVAIAGMSHSLALTSDGQVFAWGNNFSGQLGNNSTANSPVPAPVDMSGALAGQTVVAVAAGMGHSLALTTDGKVFSWGNNYSGQLGNNSTTSSPVPVPVDTSGPLAGKPVATIAAGDMHSMALTSDGQVFAWGYNSFGQLGNNSTQDSPVPVAAGSHGVLSSRVATGLTAGGMHSIAMLGEFAPTGSAPIVIAQPTNTTIAAGSNATFTASASGGPIPTVQWQVSITGVGGTFVDITGNPTATTGTLALPNVTLAQNGSAYRAVFTNGAGVVTTNPAILTVTPDPTISGNFKITESTDAVEITGYVTKPTGALELPAKINAKPVTIIGDGAFFDCDGLTGLTLPVDLIHIRQGAFQGCIGLTNVMIPPGVTSIGALAFENCNGLTSVTIPGSVTGIGDGAFAMCWQLASAEFLGDAPTTMGGYVFDGADPNFTVGFHNGATGFTTPRWMDYASRNLDVLPLSISTTTLPVGSVGAAYSQTLQATGGVAPYTWSRSAGSLPAGLTLGSNGSISGNPTSATTAGFTVQVTDANNFSTTADFSLTITSPFATWQGTKFTSADVAAGRTGPAADFDGDGQQNLLEYAFGTNPKSANTAGIASNVSNNKLWISFPCDAACTDITYTVQASSTLAADSWTDIAKSVGGATTLPEGTSSTVSDSGIGLRTVTVTEKDAFTGGRRFLRVKVTSP